LRYAFDDPRAALSGLSMSSSSKEDLDSHALYAWRTRLCARVKLERTPATTSPSEVWDETTLHEAVKLVLTVLAEARPHPEESHNIMWLAAVIGRHRGLVPLPASGSVAFNSDSHLESMDMNMENAMRSSPSESVQARAKLGAWLAMMCEDLGPATILQLSLFRLFRANDGSEGPQIDPRIRALRATRQAARARVYDLSRYCEENDYGAFFEREEDEEDEEDWQDEDGSGEYVPWVPGRGKRLDDLSTMTAATKAKTAKHVPSPQVDWTHVRAQMAVVCMNMYDEDSIIDFDETEHFQNLRPPRGVEHLRQNSAPVWQGEDPKDWAGVEGHWRRVVCFMDYRWVR
jgi:hypothetical protein